MPLLPTFALVLYNGIQLESLITRSNLLAQSFEQVSKAIHRPLALDERVVRKISKGHFFHDIENSFHEVT